MRLFHRLSFRIFLLTLILSNMSCIKSYGIDTTFELGTTNGWETTIAINSGQSGDTLYMEQSVLFNEMQARRQVYDLQEYKDVLSICFKHGRKARFSENVFPVLKQEAGQWIISGHSTGIPVRKDDTGAILLPSLSIGEDGFWSLDSLHTDFPAEVYNFLFLDKGDNALNIKGILLDDDKLFIYQSDNTVRKYPVIKEAFYLVTEYWMELLVEKEKMAEAAIQEAEGDCASFVFFTDSHWGKNMKKSPALIRHITDFTPIDDVLFGGDVITTHFTNLVAPVALGKDFQASFSFLGTNFHCLYGNHDNNSDGQRNKPEYHLSEEQVYSWLQSQMTDVVYGDYYNFYYDDPSTKTRIICLDTGRYYYIQFLDKMPDTVKFAISALNTLREGWHAIMASHIWCLNKTGPDGNYIQYIGNYITPLLKVFDDFNSHLSGLYDYKGASIPYDFTNSRGTIEFCIGGHTHIEYTTQSEGGIPILINISDYAKTPQPGTNQEQSVTMVVVDYKNRKLSLFAVGRGTDRFLDL